jgi:hypothetical protein
MHKMQRHANSKDLGNQDSEEPGQAITLPTYIQCNYPFIFWWKGGSWEKTCKSSLC